MPIIMTSQRLIWWCPSYVKHFTINKKQTTQKWSIALGSVAQLAGASSCRWKGHRFNSQSWHMPRLQVWSPVRVRIRRQPINIYLLHQCFPLSPPSSLPKSSENNALWLGLKKKKVSNGYQKSYLKIHKYERRCSILLTVEEMQI